MKKRLISAVAAAAVSLSLVPSAVTAEAQAEAAAGHAYEPFNKTEEYSAPHTSDTVIFAKRNGVSLYSSDDDMFSSLGLSGIEELAVGTGGEVSLYSDEVRVYRAYTSMGVEDTVSALEECDDVIYAEPEYLYYTQELETSDESGGDQWYLGSVNAESAWSYIGGNGGSADTVIAVIDTGVDYTHQDLAHAMWVNPGEIPGNGKDDDGNGYIDDVHGCSTVYSSSAHSGDPMDDHGHGTHVAGIIGMQPGNGTGGTGIAYGCRIMAVKAGQASGVFSSADIAEAIDYARVMGADVINMSFGSYAESEVVRDALERAAGSCVLVAAAGNDGLPALPAVQGRNMYPAAYNWVIGVMSGERDGSLSSFSNFDSQQNSGGEYELRAPGSGIYSTLPGNRYAVWSGTSMAAPMVSAAAALLRSEYSDKSAYSSRFIMGQLVSSADAYSGLDIYGSLTNKPQPDVVYSDFYVFDTDTLSASNDGDGIADAGETLDIAVVLKNRWTDAYNVSVSIDSLVNGMENRYVQVIEPYAYYGNIGVFGEADNGMEYSSEREPTGVSQPFRIRLSDDVPNDTVIKLNVSITAYDSPDMSKAREFSSSGTISFAVQNGRELGGAISEDMTLTNDHYWIINSSIRIEQGVTVDVEPGTQIQFWSSEPLGVYDELKEVYIIVDGTLNINGTAEQPVEMFPGAAFANYPVYIKGNAYIRYAMIQNPSLDVAECDHVYGVQTYEQMWIDSQEDNIVKVFADRITNSRFENFAKYSSLKSGIHVNEAAGADCVLLDNSAVTNVGIENGFTNCVFLISPQLTNLGIHLDAPSDEAEYVSVNNAILGRNLDPDPDNWIRMRSNRARGYDTYFPYNYWGTVSEDVIDRIIVDQDDDISKGKIYYEPYLLEPAESAYPCVSDISVYDSGGNITDMVGMENITVKVRFNRDMDTGFQPMVSFGPSEPYTDFVLSGGWEDSRTWSGQYGIKPSMGDGIMYFRVEGAVAADDPWLVSGNDWGRYRFEIFTTGTEAMALQARAGERKIELSWMQDDYETLAGYNIYRATDYGVGNLSYSRINDMLIPKDITEFTDTNVDPNYTYYYKFTVVLTDFTESYASPEVAARPLDSSPPAIAHTPVKSGTANTDIIISAGITDNSQVETAVLFYRQQGNSQWEPVTMQHGEDGIYFATIPADAVTGNIEYYIEAGDGISVSCSGSADNPYLVQIDSSVRISSFSPLKARASGGEGFSVRGVGFTDGARVFIGGAEAESVKTESNSLITGTLPRISVGVYDVTVSLPDGRTDTLKNALEVTGDDISVQIVSAAGKCGDVVFLPLTVNNGFEISSADIELSYDDSQLELVNITAADGSDGFMLEYRDDKGIIKISMASAEPLENGNELCVLQFKIKENAVFESSRIGISSALVNGAAVEAVSGSITLAEVYNVSGAVSYYSHGGAVGNTVISFGNGVKAVTGADGSFIKRGLAAGEYTVTPSGGGGNGGISAYDAALTLQSAVGRRELEGGSAAAADVNRDGQINSVDAALILKAASGSISESFGVSPWIFIPQSMELELDSDRYIDFTAVKLGDVSGNWETDTVLYLTETNVKTYHAPKGSVLMHVPVSGSELEGYDDTIGVDITIDASGIDCKSIVARLPQELSGSCSIEQSFENGVLKAAVMSETPVIIDGDKPLVILDIELNEKFSGKMTLNIAEIRFNERIALSDAEICIEELEPVMPQVVPAYGESFKVSADCLDTDTDMSGTLMYTAAYDSSGRLVRLWVSGYSGGGFELEEVMTVNAESLRSYLWDGKTLKPFSDTAVCDRHS